MCLYVYSVCLSVLIKSEILETLDLFSFDYMFWLYVSVNRVGFGVGVKECHCYYYISRDYIISFPLLYLNH